MKILNRASPKSSHHKENVHTHTRFCFFNVVSMRGWMFTQRESESRSVTLCDPMDYTVWNSPGQNSGVGSLSLLQGIFPTQGSNPSPPHCRQILYQLSHKGSPNTQHGGLYFIMLVHPAIKLHALDSHRAVGQLYFHKTGRKK